MRYLEDDDIPEPNVPPEPVDKELEFLIIRLREKNKEYAEHLGLDEVFVYFKELGKVRNVGPYKCKIAGYRCEKAPNNTK